MQLEVVIQTNLHHSTAATQCLVEDMLSGLSPLFRSLMWVKWVPLLVSLGPEQRSVITKLLRGRATIFSKGWHLILCPGYPGKDVVTCQLHLDTSREVFVVSVHSDTNIDHVPLQLTWLLEDKRGCDILIAMDANTHSSMWDSKDSNKRNDMNEEFIFCNDLTICNKGF